MNAGECRRRLGLPVDGHYVAFVGTFQRWQGLTTLLYAAQEVIASVPDARLLLVGDGPKRQNVAQCAARLGLEGHVLFSGWCTEQQTVEHIGASDVCVARYSATVGYPAGQGTALSAAGMTGSPLKVYTYMACGRPVVASRLREAGQLVEEAGAGIAVPPDDARALSAAIVRILNDAPHGACRPPVYRAQPHTWASAALELAAFLERVVRRSRRMEVLPEHGPDARGRAH